MGDWKIHIEGVGAHGNKDFPADADKMARRFTKDLMQLGHRVNLATFISSDGREDLIESHMQGVSADGEQEEASGIQEGDTADSEETGSV